jgi:hypothetical protein
MIFGSNKHKYLLAIQMKGQQANSLAKLVLFGEIN